MKLEGEEEEEEVEEEEEEEEEGESSLLNSLLYICIYLETPLLIQVQG